MSNNLLPQFENAALQVYELLKEYNYHVSTEIKIVENILIQLKQDAADQIKQHEGQIESLKKLI